MGCFFPDGNIQFRTITYTKKHSTELVIGYWEKGEYTWDDYYAKGFTVRKVVVNIKLLTP